jgi:hypothetical protein
MMPRISLSSAVVTSSFEPAELAVFEDREEEVGLVDKVGVEGALGEAGSPGDLLHGRGVVAELGELSGGFVEQESPRALLGCRPLPG